MFDLKDLMSRVNLPQDITRRGFLQVATVTAAFAAMNQSRAQTGAQPYIILETPKGLIVGDPSLCVDCQRCEMACTEFNDGKNDPVLARIRIGRNIWYGPGNPGARPLQGVWGDSTVYQDTCRQCATLSLVLMPARRVPSASTPRPAPAMWMKTSASAADSARKPVRGT
jgi:uncharacterized ferredoxin-like protein ydhY